MINQRRSPVTAAGSQTSRWRATLDAGAKLLMNSYGKTWHTWHTGRHDGEPGMTLPKGDPKLMWSFNREGACDPALAQDRDRVLDIDTAAKAADRQDFLHMAHPQQGIDDMASQFTGTRPIPGVVDEHDPDGSHE